MIGCRRVTSCVTSFVFIVIFLSSCINLLSDKQVTENKEERDAKRLFEKTHPDDDLNLPLIFVGGMPRSGTTLMRTMLETHPDIRCGPETHVIPELMIERTKWLKIPDEANLLREAGVEPKALDVAMGKFMLEIIKHHAPPATYYCNKDPFVLADMKYVHQLFPNSKFLLMVRDGRASAHSVVSRKITISNVDYTDYRLESSTDQVKKPLYLDALTSWFHHIPADVERDMETIAPMLAVLGYDPRDPEPKYGDPDDFVLGKLKL